MRMDTIIGLYGKGNEIIFWHSLCVGSCLILSGNCRCMCRYHWRWSTKFGQVGSVMTMFAKVQKFSLVMTISIHICVWLGKRWKTSFYTWVPFSDVIVALVFRSISWVAMCSLLHGQCSKWIPKSLMVWPHWYCERCATVVCGIPRWIQNVVKKWVKNKRNERLLRRINNQALIVAPT
jgi:hypothetical protein